MIECACYCDGESEGAFTMGPATAREYRYCTECGATIWPWESHTVGYWWDCSCCEDYDNGLCDYPGEDGCDRAIEPDQVAYMCGPCNRVCDQLLCGCWWFGRNWEQIANRNEMSLAECLGGEHAGSL